MDGPLGVDFHGYMSKDAVTVRGDIVGAISGSWPPIAVLSHVKCKLRKRYSLDRTLKV